MILQSQQLEINTREAQELCQYLHTWLSAEIHQDNRLTPFEILAAVQLRQVYTRMIRKITAPGVKKKIFKITFTAPELIAMNQIISEFPVELYNLLSQVDRKILNYEPIVDFHYYQEPVP